MNLMFFQSVRRKMLHKTQTQPDNVNAAFTPKNNWRVTFAARRFPKNVFINLILPPHVGGAAVKV